MALPYLAFCGICVTVLKEVNLIVDEPYMDEPFHVPQAQAYCRGEWTIWDPKITTPPGLYIMSLLIKRLFLFKCTLPMLRLTTMLSLLALPIVLTRLLSFHKRERPPASLLEPAPSALVLASFPIAWFFGFLYYTEVPSTVAVVMAISAATQDNHWQASLLGIMSCFFRQTNIVWVLYAFSASQLMDQRFRKPVPGTRQPARLYDPPALEASLADLVKTLSTLPRVLVGMLPSFLPYSVAFLLFSAFVVRNGGIVLGDKSNHIPSLHVPQLYYFVAFSTAFGWPVLISGPGGVGSLVQDVYARMFGTQKRTLVSSLVMATMSVTVHLFTIHHPFLLSDNRHYTFYVWRRIYMFHPLVPYLLVPMYLACAWAWFLRVGREQTILQTLLLPVLVVPTLLPTPLLEPRYFLIPYILLRAQASDVPSWALMVEGCWYMLINAVTMGVFLYWGRVGVGRFMW